MKSPGIGGSSRVDEYSAGRVRCGAQRDKVVRHEWGVLSTASAAFSHSEGSKVPGVAVQSRGQETFIIWRFSNPFALWSRREGRF